MVGGESSAMVLTVGHARLDQAKLGALLSDARVNLLVDVRRFPGSRINPDATRAALACWLPEIGVGYRWDERLGGRRRLPAGESSLDRWWTVPAFRAYAAHTRTTEFGAALDEVLVQSRSQRVAVMCSESVWWRCHRRLIADVLVLARGCPVAHLMPDGRLVEHRVAAGARLRADNQVVWDAG